MKLAQARIVTNDVPSLTRFYQEVTGMAPEGDDVYVEFHAPALTLAIGSQKMIERRSDDAVGQRSIILDFEVADVDEERSRLADIVREFVLEPTTQPWGNRSMLFRDPDGNLINVFAVPRGPAKA
jgi:catechol 2,3-dioxygenase-like lactoylglutathione lyase family enzyme